MEFIDLKTQYKVLKNEIDMAVLNVLDKGDFIMGDDVVKLENELCKYVGAKYCVTCANGTDALVLALRALDIGAGDAVFVPDFTFFATAEAVSIVGATPILIDVDKDTFNIDPKKLMCAIENIKKENKLKPRAIIPVDLFGLPYDVDSVAKIAKANKLFIIEDGAQGFGGEYKKKKACSFGDISTTSFFPAKPLGCYGDGGAMFTNDEKLYKNLLSLRVHGKGEDKYDNTQIGYNSRLDTIQASILRIKLKSFPNELVKRNEFAQMYNKTFGNKIKTPKIPKDYSSSYAQYTITLANRDERDKVQAELKKNGIPSNIYYVKGMHNQTAYVTSPSKTYDTSSTDYLTQRVLSLPMHPYMDKEMITKICNTILNVVK